MDGVNDGIYQIVMSAVVVDDGVDDVFQQVVRADEKLLFTMREQSLEFSMHVVLNCDRVINFEFLEDFDLIACDMRAVVARLSGFHTFSATYLKYSLGCVAVCGHDVNALVFP